jgi:uncharacterized protein with von Willebrand factor type A (vWA) domain
MKRKFDKGGSVMDKPSRDMRDPAYRKELEKKQALQESPLSPEDLVIGPAKRVYEVGRLAYGAQKASKAVPEIGSNVSRMVSSSKDDLAKRLGLGAERDTAKAAKELKDFKAASTEAQAENIQKLGDIRFKGKLERQQRSRQRQAASGREELGLAGKYQIAPLSYGTIGNAAMEAEDKASGALQRVKEGMKKGGKVKSASARADGIAIRGKTRA